MQVTTVKYIFYAILVLVFLLFIIYKILTESKYAEKAKDDRLLKGFISTIEWLTKLVPPLLLLPLFIIPFDIFTSLLWLVCGIAAVVSLYNLCKRADINRKIRPILTIIIFFSAAIYMFNHTANVQNEIDNLALATASIVRATCDSEGACPEQPPDWIIDRGRACTKVEFMRACYHRYEDNLKFMIRVQHSMGNELLIRGGVNIDLQKDRVLD